MRIMGGDTAPAHLTLSSGCTGRGRYNYDGYEFPAMKPSAVLLVALLMVGAGLLAAGCTQPGGDVAPPPGTATPIPTATETETVTTTATMDMSVPHATFAVAADNLAFDTSTITVPAEANVTITFENRDDGIPHNIAVYTNASAVEEIFVGETVTGPGRTTYTFTAPEEPGTYFFRCDVHPQQMTGDFIVE